MRIAQVAPLFESVPPEAVRRDGAGRLVPDRGVRPPGARRHAVRQRRLADRRPAGAGLPAGPLGDARVPGDAAPPRPPGRARGRRGPPVRRDPLPPRLRPFPRRRAACPARRSPPSTGGSTRPTRRALFETFPRSRSCRSPTTRARPIPGASWRATVHHGMPLDVHTFREAPGTYLAFLGRISPEKGLDKAVEIARRAGLPLRVAAKIYPEERDYYEEEIEPLLRASPWVEFVGEVGGAAKDAFLGNAHALLFPIDWAEPFGLVMIESMACGTPIVAFRRGSVPEVMADGVTGFVVDDVAEAVEAVARVRRAEPPGLPPGVRGALHVRRMARDYLAVYRGLIGEGPRPIARREGGSRRTAAGRPDRASRRGAGPPGEAPVPTGVLTWPDSRRISRAAAGGRPAPRPGRIGPGRRAHPGPQARRHLRRLRPPRPHQARRPGRGRALPRGDALPLVPDPRAGRPAAGLPRLDHPRRERPALGRPDQPGRAPRRQGGRPARHAPPRRPDVPLAGRLPLAAPRQELRRGPGRRCDRPATSRPISRTSSRSAA